MNLFMKSVLTLTLPVISFAITLSAGDYNTFSARSGYLRYHLQQAYDTCSFRQGETSAILLDSKLKEGYIPVGVSYNRFDVSHACGACVEVADDSGRPLRGRFENRVTAPFRGIVTAWCETCFENDIDFPHRFDYAGLPVRWRFVECEAPGMTVFTKEKSASKLKILVQGLSTPIREFSINGVAGVKTINNYFEFSSPSAVANNAKISATDVLGKEYNLFVNEFKVGAKVTPTEKEELITPGTNTTDPSAIVPI